MVFSLLVDRCVCSGLVGMFRVLWVSLYPVVVCYGVFAGGAGGGYVL